MAEIEYGGIKVGGSKLLLVLPLLATLGGGAWATFEFYKDYTDMKEIIANIDTQKIESQQKQINQQLTDAIDYSRDIKNGLREDIVRLERIVDKVEDDMNKLEDKTRTYVDDAEERFDTKRDALLNQYVAQKDILIDKVEQLKKYMDNKLQRALDNPLAKQSCNTWRARMAEEEIKAAGFHPADTNGDGKVTKEEQAMYLEFKRKELEDADAMRDAQRSMAWFALFGMLLYPAIVLIANIIGMDQAAKILGDMAAVYFVSVAAIVAAFFGAQAVKKK